MSVIPDSFRVLDPYLDRWGIHGFSQRIQARLAASIEELTELQAAVLPHLETVITVLDSYPLDEIPAELRPYGDLVLTVVGHDLAVNRFRQISPPHGYGLDTFQVIETGDWC